MTKFHVVWYYRNGAQACSDIVKAGNALDAHNKAQKIAQNLQTQDRDHREIVVGTITRLQA